jgi:hypothetical protein
MNGKVEIIQTCLHLEKEAKRSTLELLSKKTSGLIDTQRENEGLRHLSPEIFESD